VLASARRHFAVEERRESNAPPDEYDGVIGINFDSANRKWSASALTKIGSCPFKWFAEKVLRLGTPDDAETDLPPNVKGSLYHKTLEIAVRKAMDAADIRTAVLDVLEEAFAEAELSDNISIEFVANWDLRRSEHLEKLRFAIKSEAFIGEGCHVAAIEKEFEAEWHGLKIRGKLDRIDETPHGLMAVDYKTGSYTGKVKDEHGELTIDLQLPTYSQAALPSLYPGKAITSGIYLRLAKGKAEKEKPVELERFAASVRSILREGRFAVDPDVDQKTCRYCEYDPVCRRGPRLGRKKQLQ
jgi:ATP-dependent helicase/DNAse subunit B